MQLTENCMGCREKGFCNSQKYVTAESGKLFRVCPPIMQMFKLWLIGEGCGTWRRFVRFLCGANGSTVQNLERYLSLAPRLRVLGTILAVQILILILGGFVGRISRIYFTKMGNEPTYGSHISTGLWFSVPHAYGQVQEPLGKSGR